MALISTSSDKTDMQWRRLHAAFSWEDVWLICTFRLGISKGWLRAIKVLIEKLKTEKLDRCRIEIIVVPL